MATITRREYDGDDDMLTATDVFGDLLKRLEPQALIAMLEAMVDHQDEVNDAEWPCKADKYAYEAALDELTDVAIAVMEQRG